MWMFAGENREAPSWPQRAELEGPRQWGGRLVPVWRAEQVELVVELERRVRVSVCLGALFSEPQGQDSGLEPLDEGSSSGPWGQALSLGSASWCLSAARVEH